MRLFMLPALVALLVTPALAQQVSPMTGTTTTTPAIHPAAPAAAPAKPAARTHRSRRTMQQRFDAANTSHDGKLTLAQAEAGKWTRVTGHFAAIDTAHRGYVTIDDIHAYNRAQYAARRAAKKAKATGSPKQ